MISLINTTQSIAIQQLKSAFATNGIILTNIHWKISINLLINSKKIFFTVHIRYLYLKRLEDNIFFQIYFFWDILYLGNILLFKSIYQSIYWDFTMNYNKYNTICCKRCFYLLICNELSCIDQENKLLMITNTMNIIAILQLWKNSMYFCMVTFYS